MVCIFLHILKMHRPDADNQTTGDHISNSDTERKEERNC